MTWEPVVIERDEEDTLVTFGSWITVGELIEGLRKLPPDIMLAFSDSTYFGEDPDDGATELPDDDHLDFVTTITLCGPVPRITVREANQRRGIDRKIEAGEFIRERAVAFIRERRAGKRV